jgi:peptide/nickel transport system ATP-binding protein
MERPPEARMNQQAQDTAILTLEGLTVALPPGADRPHAVEGISFDLHPGEILCIVGESGSGKSVLSAALMGALAPGLTRVAGRIGFQGRDISSLPEKEWRALRGNRIAMIFQEPMAALNPAQPVGEQVAEVFDLHDPRPQEARREAVLELFRQVGLPNPPALYQRYPHQLSGGQCQRVVISMALALKPSLLIADEPTTALDVTTQAQILKLVRELRTVHRHGILFITHDFGVVAEIADRVAVMQQGRLVEIGPAAQVLNQPRHPYTRALIAAVPSLNRTTPAKPESDDTALKIEGLCKNFGSYAALQKVSLSLPRGRTLGIVGESGSGKSTLAKTLIRLLEPSGGRVLVAGVDFLGLQGAGLRGMRRMIQMVFQDPYGSLNPRHRVGEIIARAARVRGLTAIQAQERACELLELVGLKREAYGRRPQEFSGGQRQRVGIARALAMEPDILIFDESVSALDVSIQKQVLDLIADLQQRLSISILFITHDLRVAAQVCDRIAVMCQGELVEEGPAEQVLTAPRHTYTASLIDAAPGRHWVPPVAVGQEGA